MRGDPTKEMVSITRFPSNAVISVAVILLLVVQSEAGVAGCSMNYFRTGSKNPIRCSPNGCLKPKSEYGCDSARRSQCRWPMDVFAARTKCCEWNECVALWCDVNYCYARGFGYGSPSDGYEGITAYIEKSTDVLWKPRTSQYCTDRETVSPAYTAVQCEQAVIPLGYCGYAHKYDKGTQSYCLGCNNCDDFTSDSDYTFYVNPDALWKIPRTSQYCTDQETVSPTYTALQCQQAVIPLGYCGYAHKFDEATASYCLGCNNCDDFTSHSDYTFYVNPDVIWPIAVTGQYCTDRETVSPTYTAVQCQQAVIPLGYCGYAHKYDEATASYCLGCNNCDDFTSDSDYNFYVNPGKVWPIEQPKHYCSNVDYISPLATAFQCQEAIIPGGYCGFSHSGGTSSQSYCYGCKSCEAFTYNSQYDVHIAPHNNENEAIWEITRTSQYCTDRETVSPTYTAVQCEQAVIPLGYCGYAHKFDEATASYCLGCNNCDDFTSHSDYTFYVNPGANDDVQEAAGSFGDTLDKPVITPINPDVTDAAFDGGVSFVTSNDDAENTVGAFGTSKDDTTSFGTSKDDVEDTVGAFGTSNDGVTSFGASSDDAENTFGSFGTKTGTSVFGGRLRWSVAGFGIGVALAILAVVARRRRMLGFNTLPSVSGV